MQTTLKVGSVPIDLDDLDGDLISFDGSDRSAQNLNFDGAEIDEKLATCLLSLWRSRAQKAARAHYKESLIYRRRNVFLTVLNAIFSILILFVTNSTWVENGLNNSDFPAVNTGLSGADVSISALAVALVVTTILQYILGWGEKSAQHHAAGIEFANLQRRSERYMHCKCDSYVNDSQCEPYL